MATDEYIAELEEHRKLSNEAVDKYKKLVEGLDREIAIHQKYEETLKEIICRLIEGRISEENKEKLLEKFRN